MAKQKVTVTISPDLLEWIDAEVKKRRFADRSHAIEYCLAHVKDQDQK